MIRAIKFCGGCNPRYDRIQAARCIEQKIGEKLTSPQQGVLYDEIYVICGCSACCADLSSYKSKQFIIIYELLE